MLFKKANALPIQQLYILRMGLLGHSTYYSDSFDSPHSIAHYPTRYSMFSLPYQHIITSSGQRQVSYQIAKIWDDIPTEIRKINNQTLFKTALKQHLLDYIP